MEPVRDAQNAAAILEIERLTVGCREGDVGWLEEALHAIHLDTECPSA